jgi:hypothetical protein
MTSPARAPFTPPPEPVPPGDAALPASPALDAAMTLVRVWTRAYTWRLEPVVRDRRRAEIGSELWEFQQDPGRGNHPAAHVIARLVIGIPDDLSWRAEYATARRTPLRARLRLAAWTVATLVVLAALWILPLMTAATLPPLPDKPRVVIKAPPPPAPPPPPPCAPAGFPQHRPCTS